MTETNTVETETIAAPEAAAVPGAGGPTINIVDLQNAVRVIDFAADQGAFKGWSVIEQVLTVRNKLSEFVTANVPPEAEQPTAAKGKKKKGK